MSHPFVVKKTYPETKFHPFFLLDITEIGRCAKAYCEHTARSIPTLSDTVVTLIEMGKITSVPTCGLCTANRC